MQRLGFLGTLGARVAAAKVDPAPVAVTAVVEVPVAPEPQIIPVAEPGVFLSPSESVEAVPQSISLDEVTTAASEEQCASPPAPASTASSHTESSSE